MNQQKSRHQDHQLFLFMLMACLFLVFFVYQLTVTFTSTIDQWDITHYVWLGFLATFIILCTLKYKSVYAEVIAEQKELDLDEKVLTFKKDELEHQLMNMNPYDFSELVADLFRAKGYKRIFSNPRVAHQFYDIEMYLDDKKVLVSCKLNADRTPVTQAYLDRLYLHMRNLQMDEGYFVTLSDFSPECYGFIANKRIELMNGTELIETLLQHSDL